MNIGIDKNSEVYKLHKNYIKISSGALRFVIAGVTLALIFAACMLAAFSRGSSAAGIGLAAAMGASCGVCFYMIKKLVRLKKLQSAADSAYMALSDDEKREMENDVKNAVRGANVILGEKYFYTTEFIFCFAPYSRLVWMYDAHVNMYADEFTRQVTEKGRGSYKAVEVFDEDGARMRISERENDSGNDEGLRVIGVDEIKAHIKKQNPRVAEGYTDMLFVAATEDFETFKETIPHDDDE